MFDAVEYEQMRSDFLSKENVRFTIVKKILEVSQDEHGVTLLCEGRHYRKGLLIPLFTQDDLVLLSEGTSEPLSVRIDLCTPEIFRLRLVRGETVPERHTEMVVNEFEEPVEFEVRQEEEKILIATKAMTVVIQKHEWNLSVYDQEHTLIYHQYTEDKHSISHIVKEQDESYIDSFAGFECYPFGIATDLETQEEISTEAITLHYDEHFYGFGEKFGPLDKSGQEVLLWQTDALGTSTAKSYKNIPFFMSTKGYGIFQNTTTKTKYLMGSYFYKAYQMLSHEGELDYFFIYGKTMKDILRRYTEITGKTPMVPKWSFGLWMSKNTYRSQEELLSVAKMIREKEIPCDVVHLDIGWFESDWMCDFEFSKERFPDPKTMTQELKALGFRLSMWQLPYLKKENKLYPEAVEKGYFARNPDGTVSTREADGVIDFSNPEAVKWYQGLIGNLLENGAFVIKADFGEGSEESANYHNYPGKEMHNLYPLLYQKAVFEKTQEVTGEGILWGRSAYAGCQRYPLHWGGDAGTDFASLYHSIRGGLSFGLSGFPFWSHDVGGYYCDVEPEVYIRWAQVGMFSSHMRMHGTTSREPWTFGPEIEAIFLKYARLRYRLLPYIYSMAVKCCQESLPMMRALVLEFQDDPTTYTIDDQYMFGDSILVAPILSYDHHRKVYLPTGAEWFDYFTKERLSGGQWIDVEAPLDVLPLYIRAGSVIPMGEEIHYVDEKPLTTLTLDYYSGLSDVTFTLLEKNEEIRIHIWERENIVEVFLEPLKWAVKVIANGMEHVEKIVVNGIEIRPSEENYKD